MWPGIPGEVDLRVKALAESFEKEEGGEPCLAGEPHGTRPYGVGEPGVFESLKRVWSGCSIECEGKERCAGGKVCQSTEDLVVAVRGLF